MEGFGLPVIESLSHGKPCICSARGALGESAYGGGCVMLDVVDANTLAEAIRDLLTNSADLEVLAHQARARRFKTWPEYSAALAAWIVEISQR
jgi:glycosyltransferase involved in cell wall biosynthesis